MCVGEGAWVRNELRWRGGLGLKVMMIGSKNNYECRAELVEKQGVLMVELKCLGEKEMVQDVGEVVWVDVGGEEMLG